MSYGIPTKDYKIKTLSLDEIKPHVQEFLAFAKEHPELQFFVTKIGCGLAGYKNEDIAPMFKDIPDNCIIDDEWKKIIQVIK